MADWPRLALSRDSVAGLGIAATGAVFAFGARNYGIGSLDAMQAGFFPFAAGIVAVLIGLGVFVGALAAERDEPIERPALRSVFFVAASVVLFALINYGGLVPAIMVSVTFCAMADKSTRFHEALLLAAGLAFACWLVFIRLLDLPIAAVGAA